MTDAGQQEWRSRRQKLEAGEMDREAIKLVLDLANALQFSQ